MFAKRMMLSILQSSLGDQAQLSFFLVWLIKIYGDSLCTLYDVGTFSDYTNAGCDSVASKTKSWATHNCKQPLITRVLTLSRQLAQASCLHYLQSEIHNLVCRSSGALRMQLAFFGTWHSLPLRSSCLCGIISSCTERISHLIESQRGNSVLRVRYTAITTLM